MLFVELLPVGLLSVVQALRRLLKLKQRREITIEGILEWTLEDVVTGEVIKGRSKNLLVNTGRSKIADFLRGQDVEGVNYFAVGSGVTNSAATDTILETETGRISISSTRENPSFSAELAAFAGTSSLNGTHTEAGLFGDGATATANSGVLFSRLLVSIVKTNQQSLTFVFRYGITGGAI